METITGNKHHKPHREAKATREEERVALAQDVIAQLDSKRFTATRGIYLSIDGKLDTLLEGVGTLIREAHSGDKWNKETGDWVYQEGSEEAQKELDKLLKEFLPPPENCRVCAIGAVFVAALDVHNKLKLEDMESVVNDGTLEDGDMLEYLSTWFSYVEMRDMESVFEDHDRGYRFRETILSKDNPENLPIYERMMRGIMQHIIDTKGATFTI